MHALDVIAVDEAGGDPRDALRAGSGEHLAEDALRQQEILAGLVELDRSLLPPLREIAPPPRAGAISAPRLVGELGELVHVKTRDEAGNGSRERRLAGSARSAEQEEHALNCAEPLRLPRRIRSVVRFLLLLIASLALSAGAWAKEIAPGELMICGARHCRTVSQPAQARAFSALLWGDGTVPRAQTPRVGSPVFHLRYREGPAGAIITATAIRVAGLNCGRFHRGKWYRLPPSLRGLTRGLEPSRLRAAVPPSC
jgi:hypothetical protein